MAEHVVVRCPSCSQKYRVTPASLGHKARCKKCNASFVIGPVPQFDDDTIVSWITDDDPKSQSVMGSTGIFEHATASTPAETEDAADVHASATPSEVTSLGVRLRRMSDAGAQFQFPATVLSHEDLRNAFPRKCIGCGTREDLLVHLLYWPERMPGDEAKRWAERVQATVGKLDAFRHPNDARLLEEVPKTRHVNDVFRQPFPVFACRYCNVSKEVRPQVVQRGQEDICRLTVASLSVAVDFFRNVGGRATADYHRLVEQRDLHHDAWRALDARTRHHITSWFEPGPGERFVGFFGDIAHNAADKGFAGVALTDRRLAVKTHAIARTFPLDEPARLEVVRRNDQTSIHIFEHGRQPAVVRLDPSSADDLTTNLRRLPSQWSVVS